LLAITDKLMFQFSGEGSRIPAEYETWFASGTAPSDWSREPPATNALLIQLEEQMAAIRETFACRMSRPVADRSNFLRATTVGELFHVLIAHESTHLGMIQAMARML